MGTRLFGVGQVWDEGNLEQPEGTWQAFGANVSIKVPTTMSRLSQGLSSAHVGRQFPSTVWKQELKEVSLDPGFFWGLTKQGNEGRT